MSSEFSKIETIVKNSILKIALICLISTLISFFHTSSKSTTESYNAKILFELGSLNRTQIDGLDVLNAIALSLDKNNISVEQPFNHSHYLMISSNADNFEDAKNDLDNFINLLLKRHDLMVTKRSSEIYKNIKLLNEELTINTAETNSGLVLKLIEQEDLVNSFTKSKILKDYGVNKTINAPDKSLAISIGLSIGLIISIFLVLIQYIFYSNREI